MRRIDESDKVFNINAFLNLVFVPYLEDPENKIGLTRDDINTDFIVRKLNDDKYVNAFDASNVVARLNLLSGGGLVYNDGEKTYFTGLNDSVAIYYNNNIEKYAEDKLNIEFKTVDPSGESTLATIKDSIPISFKEKGVKDLSKWYFTGNGKALYDYLSNYLTKDEIIEFSDVCDEDIDKKRFDDYMQIIGNEKYLRKQEEIVEPDFEIIEDDIKWEEMPMEDQTHSFKDQKIKLLKEEKDAASLFREQLSDLTIRDLKSKTL